LAVDDVVLLSISRALSRNTIRPQFSIAPIVLFFPIKNDFKVKSDDGDDDGKMLSSLRPFFYSIVTRVRSQLLSFNDTISGTLNKKVTTGIESDNSS